MQAGILTVARLIPALTGSDPAPSSESVAVPLAAAVTQAGPGIMVGSGAIDWQALRDATESSQDTARTRRRTRAVEYSGFYNVRLKIHRYLSFAMIPVFIGTYVTGDQVLKHGSDAPDWALNWHRPFATATAVLFTVNTVTGLWNLWDSRKDPAGRTKRWIHSLMFIAADAGFAYTGLVLAHDARESDSKRRLHRDVALVSMGVAVSSWGLMLFFK